MSNILDIQSEIDMLKKQLNQYNTKDDLSSTKLQEPESDD